MKHTLIRTVSEGAAEADAFSGCGHGPAPVAKRAANAPPVFVNGVHIAESAIAAEAQNHRAASGPEARAAAARALVIRELLLQRARTLALEPSPLSDARNREETPDEALVRQVLEYEAGAFEAPSAGECRRVYDVSSSAFMTPELYAASHILCAPADDEEKSWRSAHEKAEGLLGLIKQGEDFGACARRSSDCPTAADAGALGQMTAGDLSLELEQALSELAEGEVAASPIRTRHGWHLLRLDRRAPARLLPFEAAEPHIRARLQERLAVAAQARYVAKLAAEAEIEGLVLSFGSS